MEKTDFLTTDGMPIYTNGYINDLRAMEEGKKNSHTFIAQPGPQEDDLHSSVDILITGGNRGGGKANSYNTPIATPAGFKKMGDLQIGDEICSPYEGIQKVSNIFEQGKHRGYTVSFDDGTYCDVLLDHRFWARLSPNEPFRELTLEEIKKNYRSAYPFGIKETCRHMAEIPLAGRVQLQENLTPLELPIHPFVLGYCSGTGHWRFSRVNGAVTFIQGGAVAEKIHDCGYTFMKKGKGFYIRGISEGDISTVGLAKNGSGAIIPYQYLYGSIYTRLEYIRGAIARCGGSHKHRPYLDTDNHKYAEQFAQICRSVGWWAKIGEVTDDIEKVGFFRVLIKSPDDKDLFLDGAYSKYAHTNANVPYSPNCPDMLTKKIISIKKRNGNSVPFRCITVTGQHHLYLSDAYTVNHNTFTLLMESLYDIKNKDFHGVILRKEKNDLLNIINDSRRLYSTLGRYNKSKDDMTWHFDSGADLRLAYFEDSFDDFKDRFQGHQYAYIGIDEFTQIEYDKFKYLITCNRNAVHLHNRVIGTCNPDPTSWVAQFISWWIGEDGEPLEERNGVIRYCYMKGNDVSEIVWGNTREEVYEQCSEDIDKYWDPDYERLGMNKLDASIKSVTFIRAELKYNKILLRSSAEYLGNLMNQSEEARARDLGGNWKFMDMGSDLIKMSHLMRCFANPEMRGDGVKRASSDLAFEGGDNCVTWLWIGNHVADVFVSRMDSVATASAIHTKLMEWGVAETNYTYDLNGLGQSFRGFFKHSRPFNNRESVQQKYKGQYDTIKSQCAWIFADKIIRGEISFEPSILERRFTGKGYKNKRLADILQDERKAVRQDLSKEDSGWCIIKKDQMKKLVGHSPDFVESLFMRFVFEIKAAQVSVPDWIKRF